jgi:hypothetical protein
MVTTPPATVAVTPAGNPVTVAFVAPPCKEYVIGLMAVVKQTVCEAVGTAEVNWAEATPLVTVIVPVIEEDPQIPPVVVIV